MRSIVIFLTTASLALTAIPAVAKKVVDPTGAWKIEIELPNGQTYYPEATIKKKGKGLEGTYYFKTSEQTVTLEDVRLEPGNQLHFTSSNQNISLKYVGAIDGNQMSGIAYVDFRGQQFKADFSATREAQGGGLAGTWESLASTRDNNKTRTLIFSVGDGGKISGSFSGSNGSAVQIADAKLENGVVSFSTTGQIQGYDYVANYQGTLEGETIKGEMIVNVASAGRTREFAWEAKKVQ